MNIQEKTKQVSGNGEFTDKIECKKDFNVSITGTWTGTIALQRSFDSGVTWGDVKLYTANEEQKGYEPESNVFYRLGFDSGFGTGVANVRISR